MILVNATDFHINASFSRVCYSHKFKGAGLHYEVVVSILNGDIVWIHGPFECGLWPDIKIFSNSLMSHLGNSECVEADNGYVREAPKYVKCPQSFTNSRECEDM